MSPLTIIGVVAVIVILVLGGVAAWVYVLAPKPSTPGTGGTGGGGTSQPYFGQVSLTLNTLRGIDDAVITTASSPLALPSGYQLKAYHADWTFASNIAINSATTFTMLQSDAGTIYLINDYSSGPVTCCFLNTQKTLQANGGIVTVYNTRDINGNGVLQPYFKINLAGISVQGGQTAASATLNVWYWGNEENFGTTGGTAKLVSVINATSTLSTSGFADSHATGYFGWAGTALGSRAVGDGYLVRLTKMELTMNSNNATSVNNGNVNLRQVLLGGQTFNSATFSLSSTEFLFNLGAGGTALSAINQPTVGVDFVYVDGLSATWLGFDVWINAKNPSSGNHFIFTLKLTFVLPSGSIVSESKNTSFN